MNRPALVFVLLFVLAVALSAQSNQLVDRMLGDEAADTADAAYMALLSADMIEETASPQEALSLARERGWLAQEADGGDPTTFGTFVYMLMEAHGEAGGVMYRIFPGPRYAAKEAAFQNWTVQRRGSGEVISGEVALRVLGNFLAEEEAE
ncbi:MAG: hypothetical protein ACOC47_05515 [Alkalispirochaetaceae bacterium]